jgi:hypothetical protein
LAVTGCERSSRTLFLYLRYHRFQSVRLRTIVCPGGPGCRNGDQKFAWFHDHEHMNESKTSRSWKCWCKRSGLLNYLHDYSPLLPPSQMLTSEPYISYLFDIGPCLRPPLQLSRSGARTRLFTPPCHRYIHSQSTTIRLRCNFSITLNTYFNNSLNIGLS